MLSKVKTMALHGLEGYIIDVQIDISGGLPAWEVVGLPDASVKEAKERVRTAIRNIGIEFPSRRILVNLAPADVRKEGSFFDLPIAIGILIATENIKNLNLNKTIFLGELSLDGKVNSINGVLAMSIEAARLGIKTIIVPKENAKEAAVVKNIKVIGVETLKEVIEYLNGILEITEERIDIDKFFKDNNSYSFDFSEVKGQENIKRALEIAAARRS